MAQNFNEKKHQKQWNGERRQDCNVHSYQIFNLLNTTPAIFEDRPTTHLFHLSRLQNNQHLHKAGASTAVCVNTHWMLIDKK